MVILKYRHYEMCDRFFELIDNNIVFESKNSDNINSILRGLSNDLKFNIGLVLTFGVGIRFMFPIIENIIKNSNLKIELTTENLLLLTLVSVSITYLEEKNNKVGDTLVTCDCSSNKSCNKCGGKGSYKSSVTKEDAQTILEELKLRGIGNGIVKKVVESLKSIGILLKKIFSKSKYSINGLIDMFGYTALLAPIMNALSHIVGEYNLNVDTLPGNFLSLGVGVGTFLAKRSVNYIINKIKGKVDVNNDAGNMEIDIQDGNINSNLINKSNLIKEQ